MKLRLLPIIGPFIFIMIWGLITGFDMIDHIFLPTPWATARALFRLLVTDHDVYGPLYNSLRRMAAGFAIGVGLGVPAGVALGSSKTLYSSTVVLIDFLRSIPSTSFFPLFMLLMGVGDGPKIAVVVMGCFFVCAINSAFGVMHGSPSRVFVADVMGASKVFTFFRVRLPEAMPSISSGIRVSISYAIVLVVVSEMFVGTDVGLGRLIYDAHSSFKTPEMYATIIIAGTIGYLANKLYSLVETRIFHWSGKAS